MHILDMTMIDSNKYMDICNLCVKGNLINKFRIDERVD